MSKQKPSKKYTRYIALLLIVAFFSWSCLLPVSEAQARAGKIIQKGTGVAGKAAPKSGGSVGKSGKANAQGLFSRWTVSTLTVGAILILTELLLAVAKSFVDYMLSPDPALYNLNNAFIQRGWKVIRDICNLFFLLVLLFIAFCTILQIEKYNAKKNLLTLILMALLINFSKPIAVFIFDGSQLLMSWFLRPETRESITNSLALFSNVAKLFSDALAQPNGWDAAAVFLFGIIFTFILDVVLICLGLFLLIRIVAVWLLVIVSPVAFFAMIVPDFRKLASQWWDALFRYCYVGPAIAFFLWLANDLRVFKVGARVGVGAGGIGAGDSTSFLQMPIFIPYLITIVFLFAALMMANQFGIYFSQTITKGANKFMGWFAMRGLKMIDRDLLTKAGLSPTMWIHAWRARQKDIDEKKYGMAAATARDLMGRVLERGHRPPDYYRLAEKSRMEEKFQKEQESISRNVNYILARIGELDGRKDYESQRRLKAYLNTLEKNRDLNEFQKQYMKQNMDPYDLRDNLDAILERAGIGKNERGLTLANLSEIGIAVGDYHIFGMGVWDEEEKTWRKSTNKEMKDMQKGKIKNIDNQQFKIRVHPEAFVLVDKDGNPIGTHDLSEVYTEHGLSIGRAHWDRNRGDVPIKVLAARKHVEKVKDGRGFVAMMEDVYEKQMKAFRDEQVKWDRSGQTEPPQPKPTLRPPVTPPRPSENDD